MADAAYDAIMVGGGTKGLVTAMYLAKYGGMDVALFERRHELGGGWCTDEGPAPGFRGDYHSTGFTEAYHTITKKDFPEWDELGGKIGRPRLAAGTIFKEDQSHITYYGWRDDPTQERTAASIAKFSQKDAETWVKIQSKYAKYFGPAWMEYFYSLAPALGEPDALEKLLLDSEFCKYIGADPSWPIKSTLEVTRDVFENDAVVASLLKLGHTQHGIPPHLPGMGLLGFFSVLNGPYWGFVVGGTHSMAHAASRIISANGGTYYTHSEVDKIIIENGRARGVRLLDGTEIEARKVVVSGVDPYQLCFRLIGKENFPARTARRIAHLERRFGALAWYTWALHDLPEYAANPEMKEVSYLGLIDKDPYSIARQHDMRMLGQMPPDLSLQLFSYPGDKLRAPDGKFTVLSEQYVPPASAWTEKQWLDFKKVHAENVIDYWHEFAPNMTWDNVIGYIPHNALDNCKMLNMAPEGEMFVISVTPNQHSKYRPVPELAQHRTPISNIYATGSAWPPFGMAMHSQGYTCYKAIAQDLDLQKPWEKAGRPW